MHTQACMHARTHMHACVLSHRHTCTQTLAHTHAHAYTLTHTRAHAHTHTHTHTTQQHGIVLHALQIDIIIIPSKSDCFLSTDSSSVWDCSFEQGLCSYTQLHDDQFDWTRTHGGTASHGTGPAFDHTQGTGKVRGNTVSHFFYL